MSRRARNQTSVSLFPFLAVLLCAMGALLVLLVITTRQIRDQAIRQAAAREIESSPPPAKEPEPEYEWPKWNIVLGPAEELERKLLPVPPPPALLAPKPVYVKNESDPPPPDLTEELRRLMALLQQANAQVAASRKSAEEHQQRRAAILAETEKRETVLKNANEAIAGFQSQQQQLNKAATVLDQKSAEMTRELQKLQSQARDLASQPRSVSNVLKVVPYDGQQGTTRRPILIECANNRIRFVPEGIELTEQDLIGFQLNANPLLAGVRAADKYWTARDRSEGNLQRPYLLLIVRPDGIPAYYAARQLLQSYNQESGYELLTTDQNLALPELDPEAQQQIAHAVREMLKQRGSAPTLARTPFPQPDPELMNRLRSGGEPFGEGPGDGGGGGSQAPGPGGSPDKHFKFVQTSQGLKMVPIDEPTLKRFETPGSSPDRTVSEARAPRTAEGAAANPGGISEPAPLPSPPEGTRIRNLTDNPSGNPPGNPSANPNWTNLDQNPNRLPTSDPSASPERERDPTQVPDAWTPLLEARQNNQKQTSRNQSGSSGRGSASASSNASSARQGPSSPLGDGGLAFRRTIEVRISGTQLRIANRDPLTIPAGIGTPQLMTATVEELRREVHSWKEPPELFYWKPMVKFVVYPGGNQYIERLRPSFEEQGLLSGVEYEFSDSASDWRPTQR